MTTKRSACKIVRYAFLFTSGWCMCMYGNTGMLKEDNGCICMFILFSVLSVWLCRWVFTCCAASPLTMWGMRGTSPFRRGGGAKSSGIWSVIIIVTYIHGEIHWTALPGKVQREKEWDVCAVQLYLHTRTQRLKDSGKFPFLQRHSEMWNVKLKTRLGVFPCASLKQSNRILKCKQ